MPSFIDSIAAYRKTAELPQEVASTGGIGAPGGSSFGDVLQQTIGDSVGVIEKAEQITQLGIQGKASPIEIVTILTAAEHELQKAVSIRDKAVAAYQEISRMTV